jgi:hypothetical protein
MKKLINKIKKALGMDIDAIMSLKNSFQNQKFQLVRGKPSPRLGKLFEVMDINQSRAGFFAELNDGTKISIDSLNSDYMMIMDEQAPLTMAEINSINIDSYPSINSVNPAEISPDLAIPDDLKSEIIAPAPKPSAPAPQVSAPAQTTDLFGMFSLEETQLNISIKVQLPNKTLLKAMYQNSQNQSDFVNKLSSHINNSVTADSIKESLWKMLDPDKKKQLNDKSTKD